MADVKISNLPASTTPLAGTEVLPIVQSGTTVKVSVANLTAGRAIGATNATFTGALSVTPTWNAGATVFTGIGLNVTDTASAAGSLLLDLQVGGASQAQVNKAGKILASTSFLTGGFGGIGQNTGICFRGGAIEFYNSGPARTGVFSSNFTFGSAIGLAWSSNPDAAAASDLILLRDAADTLAQRNGVNAQTLRLYRTFTDTSNYARMNFRVDSGSNDYVIETEYTGTGPTTALRLSDGVSISLRFVPGSGLNINNAANTSTFWNFATSGHFLAPADNTYDIGASGANRPRNLFVAGNGTFGGTLDTFILKTRYINNSDNTLSMFDFDAGSVGVATFAVGGSAPRLRFGGTTSSFPALKRNSTALETKLADDSAYAPHAMQYLDVTDGITAPAAATGRARIYVDTADGDLKVIFADGTIKTIVTDT